MYKTIADFKKDWNTEKDLTKKIFNSITDESLPFRSYEGGRNIGKIAWHITASVSEMGKMAGFEIDLLDDAMPENLTASAIVENYDKVTNQLAEGVDSWKDEILDEEIELYGEKWTRAFTLQVLVRHQIHHRAQMTVMMRGAGLKVPGIYGPSKEEWALYNIPAME
jgi:uncharacterized damage-inducible protein DinB